MKNNKAKLVWHTEKRKIKDLIPYKGNPRQMTKKQQKDLENSLAKFNLVEIPAIDTDNKIIAGHQRLKILKLLGRGKEIVDVRIPSRKLTNQEFKEYNLRSNKNVAEWDYDLLKGIEENLLAEVGFEDEQLDEIYSSEINEDDFNIEEELEKIKKPKSKLGDLYQLGEHRLLCGDATKKEDVERLMDGKKADMVFTDPPYNVAYKGTKFDKIKGDEQTEEDFIKFTEDFIARMSESIKIGGVFYICSGYSSYPIFLYGIKKNNLVFSTPIIWVKNNTSLGWGDYRHKHEMVLKVKNIKKKARPILYGWNNGKHYFADTRFEADVWQIKRRAGNTMVHPTQKPLELCARGINNSSKRGEIILDLFTGGGSTLISAEKEGRICYGMELDPIYVDIIINRWEYNFKGKAVKL